MLNSDKIILMTKLALYEENKGKNDIKKSKYYKDDYIGLGLLNSGIIATLAYILVLACIVFINIEEVVASLPTYDFFQIGRVVLITYIIYMIAYLVIAYIVYRIKYSQTSSELKKYDDNLRLLYQLYKDEDKKAKMTSDEFNKVNGLDDGEEIEMSDDEHDMSDEERYLMDEEVETFDGDFDELDGDIDTLDE